VGKYCETGRLEMTIWLMCIAWWIHKATNTHSDYAMLIAFSLQNECTNAPQCYVICTFRVFDQKNVMFAPVEIQ